MKGIVAGGGVALSTRQRIWISFLKKKGDEKTGVKIVISAIQEPLRQMAVNAGLEGSIIIDKIQNSGKNGYGFDFAS